MAIPIRDLFRGLGLLGLCLAAVNAIADAAVNDMVASGQMCMGCHNTAGVPGPSIPMANGKDGKPGYAIWAHKHGVKQDSRTPAANGGCTACHDVTEHLKNPMANKPKSLKSAPAEEKNAVCTGCHQGGEHMFWEGSAHATQGVACNSCHDVHAGGNKMADKQQQTEVCFTCHKEQRAQLHRPSHHPVLEGEVACSDCHNPHGSTGPKNLKKDSVNETCYTCHMEKRGPFVRSHQPVTEDCTICHNAHGTVSANLLAYRVPYLCQQCHNATDHPVNANLYLHPNELPGLPLARTDNSRLLGTVGRGCLNCHTNIHGSNSTENQGFVPTFSR